MENNRPVHPMTEEAKKERSKLKWFLGFVLTVLILTAITDIVFSLYNKSSISNDRNPFMTTKAKNPTPIPTQKIEQMSKWKTYTNTTYGYSIQYPADAFINCGKQQLRLYQYVQECNAGEGAPDIIISVNPPFTDYTKTVNQGCYTITTEKIVLAKEYAKKYTSIDVRNPKQTCSALIETAYGQNHSIIRYVIPHNNNTYVISIQGTDVDQKTTNLRNKVISTFKFTE